MEGIYSNMNEKKKQIWKLFLKKEKSINQIQDLILNYENEFPEDVDLYLMKMWFFSEEQIISLPPTLIRALRA